MAVLNVTFCKGKAWQNTGFPVPRLVFSSAENVEIDIGSTTSSAGPEGSEWVMLNAAAACRFRIGSGTPTALATDPRMSAGQTIFVACDEGDKVAVVQST